MNRLRYFVASVNGVRYGQDWYPPLPSCPVQIYPHRRHGPVYACTRYGRLEVACWDANWLYTTKWSKRKGRWSNWEVTPAPVVDVVF